MKITEVNDFQDLREQWNPLLKRNLLGERAGQGINYEARQAINNRGIAEVRERVEKRIVEFRRGCWTIQKLRC